MKTSREELMFALLALSTSHEGGLIASRRDAPTVAVGFIPRLAVPDAPRRGATPESGAVISIVAPRRRSLGALNRGLKATATITKSLCDSGTAQGKKANLCQ